ncbi:MAG TPA: GDP-mannose 4,6-dehydratase, partial [Polyangiaceae bacterium LLY-WYZ-15_(1-7)]|nr:GDP-mannose 4,6-dehydratase [Polyangiaceae bacterium LLY-WYZ-15_(1-7)]
GLDNLNDYYDPARKRANLAEVAEVDEDDRFLFVRGDIRDRELLAKLFFEHTFDSIVHLAAMAGVRNSVENPHLYYDVNLTGTLNLLEEAKKHDVQMVFASTSSAYGRTEQIPFIETDHADRPLAPYPASKRSAELLGHSYHHLHGVKFTALRFFTVYGPRGRPDMMAYKVLDNIYTGRHVPLYNAGQMHRDWTYVTDIAQGIAAAVDHPCEYEVINLGRGEPILLADFVKMLEELAGQPSNLENRPMLAADVAYTYASIDKARELLSYDPKVTVEEGVKSFFDWYRQAVSSTQP